MQLDPSSELRALSSLSYGHGLPVVTERDLQRVQNLRLDIQRVQNLRSDLRE
jgi:hypothetical protein